MERNHPPDDSELADAHLTEEPISVLLVDDDESWTQFMSRQLTAESDDLRVETASDGREALTMLEGGGSVDCIVADYQMPGLDGVELLRRVREEWPTLPYLLVTGAGSEEVASEAIHLDVSGYLLKDPTTDQAPLFAARIEAAVAKHRLRTAIAESEERYRTLIEQSTDAIAVWRGDELTYFNDRLVDLTGFDRETLREVDFVADLVVAADRERVDAVLSDVDDPDHEFPVEFRLSRADDVVCHCELTGRTVDYGGRPATLVSIRDITGRERRERQLQWERKLNRAIQAELVNSRTQQSLETAVVEELFDAGYDLAWIAGVRRGAVRPRESCPPGHVWFDGVDVDAADPSARALESSRPQFVQDVETVDASWADRAVDAGVRAVAAIPLRYDDAVYGVLGVAAADPGRFHETEQRFLTELATTVGFAVHALLNEKVLTADTRLDVRVRLDGGSYYLQRALAASDVDPATTVAVEQTGTYDDRTVVQYLSVRDGSLESVLDAVEGQAGVADVRSLDEDRPRLQVRAEADTPEALLHSYGAIIRESTVRPDGVELSFELSTRAELRAIIDRLDGEFGEARMLSCVEREVSTSETTADAAPADLDLSEKERVALRAAYRNGYFAQPREQSATEIADSLGVSHSTFLRHLRRAQQRVLERYYRSVTGE